MRLELSAYRKEIKSLCYKSDRSGQKDIPLEPSCGGASNDTSGSSPNRTLEEKIAKNVPQRGLSPYRLKKSAIRAVEPRRTLALVRAATDY